MNNVITRFLSILVFLLSYETLFLCLENKMSSNKMTSSPTQSPANSTPIMDSVPESIVPVTTAGSSNMGVQISSPAEGLTVNQGTSNLIDPLLANEIHTETNMMKRLNESVGIADMNTQTTMDRRSLVASRDWITTVSPGTSIYKDQFPYCLFSSPSFPGAQALGIHEYVGAEAVEFTLQVSASPFSVGALMLLWSPSHTIDLNKSDTNDTSLKNREMFNYNNAIDCYSMILNIGEGNTATLTVPLTNALSILRTKTERILWDGRTAQTNFEPRNFNFWGNIEIKCFNKLEGVTAEEDQNLSVKLWARLIQPQTSLLVPYRNPVASSLETEGAMMSVAAAVGSALASAAPSLAVGAATTVVNAAAAGIAHKVGKKCTYYTETGEDPMAMNLSLTNDHRAILSLGYDTADFQDTTTDLTDSPAELDFKGIAARRSRIFIQEWNSTASLSTPLKKFGIHPCTGMELTTGTLDNTIAPSNVGYASLMYAYWRGSLTYTFEVVGNAYSRGALLVVYQPHGDTAVISDSITATSYPHAVINIAETRKFSLRVPYNMQTAWARTPIVRPIGSGGMNLITSDTLGTLSLFVMNPIRTNNASTITVLDVNIYIHSTDIDFRAPYLNGALSPTSYIWKNPPPSPPPEFAEGRVKRFVPDETVDVEEDVELEGNLEVDPLPGAEIFGPGSDPTSTRLMPTSHTDIRQLLTRRVPIGSGELTQPYSLITIPLPNVGLRHPLIQDPFTTYQYPVPSYYNMLAPCYAWQTGSQVVSLMFGNSATTPISVIAQVVYNGDENWVAEYRRGLSIEPTTEDAFVNVSDNDTSLAFNMTVNTRREIGIPWYNMVSQLLAGPIYQRLTGDDSSSIPTYMPFAFLKIYVKVKEDVTFLLSQNVGPNFQFSQFLGCPKLILYDPNAVPTPPALTRVKRFDPSEVVEPEEETELEMIKVLTNVMRCQLCDTKPANPVAFIKHLQSSHPRDYVDIPVPCPFCRKSGDLSKWEEHNVDCKMFERLQCPKCPVEVRDGVKLANHVKSAHPNSNPLDFRSKISVVDPASSQNLELQMFSTPQFLASIGEAADKVRAFVPDENLQDTIDETKAEIFETTMLMQETTQKMGNTADEVSRILPSVQNFMVSGTETFSKMKDVLDSLSGAFKAVGVFEKTEKEILKNRTRIFASAARAVRDGDWEPIFTEVFLELFDRFTLIDPSLMTVGLKAILTLISPSSKMHGILNASLLARSSLIAEKLIPDSWKDIFGTIFQGAEDDALTFGKAILLLFAFGGTVLSGLLSPVAFFRDFSKNFSFLNMGRAALSLTLLLDSLNQIKKWIQERFFGRSIWEGYDWLVKNRQLIGEFQADYYEYMDYPLNKILNSSILRSRAIKISETAKIIAGNLAKIKTGSNEINTLVKQSEFFIQLAKQARQVPFGKIRVRPTVVTFQGDSQCGKTFLASTALPHYVNNLMRWPQEPVFMVSSATEDFMSGYSQQMITMIDDLLQMKEGKDLTGFVNMVGNAPYRVNMAALDEKGTQFLSEVVIVTMNQPHPKVDKFVTHPPAIYNRLYDFYFHVQPKPAYTKGGRLDTTTLRENDITNPDDYLDFYRQRYIDEERKPALENPLAGEKVSFFEIVRMIVENIREEELTVQTQNDTQIPPFREFPEELLPEHWDLHFQALGPNQRRAQRINSIVKELAKIRGVMVVPNQHDLFVELQWLIQEDYSENVLMGLDWNAIYGAICYGKTLYFHESQHQDHLDAQHDPLKRTKFWHKMWACDDHIQQHCKFNFTGTSGNVVFDFLWKQWRRMAMAYGAWHQAYPVLVTQLKWFAIGMAINMTVSGATLAAEWWFSPTPEPTKEDPKTKEQDENVAFFAQEAQASWYNAGSPSGGARGKVKVARPTGVKPGTGKKQAESDIPPMFPLIRRNTVRLTSCGFSIRALGWKKDILLINRHYVSMLPDGATVVMERWTPNVATARLERFELRFWKKDTVDFIYEDDQEMDLVMWKMGWRTGSFKDISNHFLNESDLDRVTGQDGYRVSDVITHFTNFAYTESEQPLNAGTMTVTRIPLAIVAKGAGEKGICGSPWIVTNPAYFGNMGKICGIHAFGGKGISGAIPITIEALESVETGFQSHSFEPSQVTMQMATDGDQETTLEFHDFHGTVPVQDAFIQPRRTEIQPSPIFGEVCDVTHQPAVLSNRDPRLENPESFDRDLVKKTDRQATWFRKDKEVDDAVGAIIDDLKGQIPKLKPRLLTLDEAINGVDGPAFMAETGLEMRNSPGYPWNRKAQGRGKYPYFKERPQVFGERLKYDLSDPDLMDRINERMSLAMKGLIPPNSIWLDVMKDELRPIEKCKSGATRIINAPPLDLMIAFNILCGAFRIHFMDPDFVGTPLESALGVDPRTAWPSLGSVYKQAAGLFGVDFSKFDSSQLAEFYRQIAKIINAWYRHYQEDQTFIDQECLARETLAYEVGNTLHLYGATLYTDDHGLPSGVPGGFTTIFNIMVNQILARITFIRTGLHVSTYRLYTRNIFQGDDGLHAVMKVEDPRIAEALKKYNRIELAKVAKEIGMTVTMPDKVSTLTEYDSFEDITFLKSSFSDAVIPGFYLPGMDKKTIGNLINWYRPRKNPDQFRTNIQEALKFAAPHGKAYYNQLVDDLKQNGKMQVLYPGSELSQLLIPFETCFYSTYMPFGLDGAENSPMFGFPFEI